MVCLTPCVYRIAEFNPICSIFQVKEVEGQIRQRKSEVEQLIKEMREANMESLAISPPEESKQFLEGESIGVNCQKIEKHHQRTVV